MLRPTVQLLAALSSLPSLLSAAPAPQATFPASLAQSSRACPAPLVPGLPVVDLGYECHQAIAYDSDSKTYNFSNIRFAQPPTGNNRFRLPLPPQRDRTTVQTGSVGKVCPNANPLWVTYAQAWIPLYLQGLPYPPENQVTLQNSTVTPATLPPPDSRTTEDCLFLDVVVPEAVYNNRGKGSGAPIVVYIYGGGFAAGDKSGSSPAGLIKSSQQDSDGIIYVAFNYRLGAFGFLSGPAVKGSGIENAALYDQRLALAWVELYARNFGGDPRRITIVGESAGGGSVLYQIAAFGGRGPAPFQQAIAQSPAYRSGIPASLGDDTATEFLSLLGVSTLAEARALPSSQLIQANALQVAKSPYGDYAFTPVTDGFFVPDNPVFLFADGKFDKNINTVIGHNADEGLLFTNPAIQTDQDFKNFLAFEIPSLNAADVNNLAENLYPPVFDGSRGYTDQIGRTALVVAEFAISCQSYNVGRAFGGATYNYLFSVPPALHTEDVAYTFADGPGLSLNQPIIIPVAKALQDIITTFAETGVPETRSDVAGVPTFPKYGSSYSVLNLNATSFSIQKDPTANGRCNYWQTQGAQ
ncbi:MAG: hypothetical protein M1828_007233 [Chrysothrix sp. TS-e1954]|nr:MAG: hypothetical protein M1828_007233 [Chrysothrix sp. TS-e1954]